MWDSIKGLLGSSAPILGSMVGGPIGGAVGTLIAGLLGVDDNADVIEKELRSNPDALLKLKQYEMDNEVKVLQMKIEEKTAENAEITERWKSDNKAGGINAKVRPYTLIYLMVAITVLALLDGNLNEFTVKDAWVTLFTSLAVTAFGGYFVLRSYEKVKQKN